MALARQHRIRQDFVFGSLLRGELQEASAIDFQIEFEEEYKLRDLIRLTQGLQQLLGRRLEVVDRHALREEIRATNLVSSPKFVTKHQRLYCRDILDRIRRIENYADARRGAF